MSSALSMYTGPTAEDLDRIPADLKARPQWVLWRASDKIDKQTGAVVGLNKEPYTAVDPDVKASSTDPQTWASYHDCVAALPVALEQWEMDDPQGYRGGGIGYVLTAADPFCGIDLDHSLDPATGALAPWAQHIVTRLASYTQRSCSSTGAHVFIEGKLPPGRCQDGDLQMWDHGRFFAMTGWHLPGTPLTIAPRQGALEDLWCEHFGAQVGDSVYCLDASGAITNTTPWEIVRIEHTSDRRPYALFAESATGWPLAQCERVPSTSTAGQPISPLLEDALILQQAAAARNGTKFTRLWNGDWTGYPSQSEADLALCELLAFWTQDPAQLTRLFEQSGLYRAAKWGKRFDYRQRTIAKALAQCSQHYQSPATLVVGGSSNGTSGTFGTALTWAYPEKLPSAFPAVPVLPEGMLPGALRHWIVDIAERQQVPLEFVAIPALIALATVVGRKIGIRPKQRDDWTVIPNLWGAIIGRPGVLKSPAMKAALAPLDRLIATAAERYQQDLAKGKAQLAAHEARIKAIKHAMEQVAKKPAPGPGGKTLAELTQELADVEAHAPVVFVERRYRTNDSTVEKLGELFQENPTGLMLFRDELSGWLRSLDKSGREGDREFFLEAWNGDGSFTVDRIGRGTIHIPALCLSMCGGIQPGKLESYIADAVAGGAGDDGLMQRFQLLVWPDVDADWINVDRYPNTAAKNAAYKVYEALDAYHTAGTLCLPFEPDAQELFDAWRAELEASLRDGSLACTALEAHLAKYRSLMPSLALLFHVAELTPKSPDNTRVPLDAARLAAEWCDFLKKHAERVYTPAAAPDIRAAQTLAEHIKRGDVAHGDPVRALYRRHWSGLDTPAKIGDALAVLEKHHWLRVAEETTGGRPTEVVYLNPALGQFYGNA